MNEREAGAKAMLELVDIKRSTFKDGETVYWHKEQGLFWARESKCAVCLEPADDYEVVYPKPEKPAVPECDGFDVFEVVWPEDLDRLAYIAGPQNWRLNTLRGLGNCPPACFGFARKDGSVTWRLLPTTHVDRWGCYTNYVDGNYGLVKATWVRLVKGKADA